MIVTTLFIALENFLSLKLDSVMKHNFSTRDEKILFFKDYDMDSVAKSLTDRQLDILIENMDQLIPLKGSDEVITKILNLFNIENIDVYKYMLFKTIKCDPLTYDVKLDPTKPRSENYDIEMIRIPINTNEDSETIAKYINDPTMRVKPKSIFLNDKYFGDKSDTEKYYEKMISDLKNSEEFAYFYTKYLGIISHIQITQALIKATRLFQQLFHDTKSLDIVCKVNAPGENTCRDLVAAINYILTLRYNISDDIMTDVSSTARIMGFNSNPNLDELRELEQYIFKGGTDDPDAVTVKLKDMIDDKEIFVVLGPDSVGGSPGQHPSSNKSKAPCTVNYEFNIKRYTELSNKIENCKNYDEYIALQKIFDYNMHTLSAISMFQGYTHYTHYLQEKTPKLYDYIMDNINNATSSIWNTEDGDSRTKEFINKCVDLVSEFVEAILKAIGSDHESTDSALNTYVDNNSAFSRIFTVMNFFKSYTVQFSNTDSIYTINNPLNCLVKLFHRINSEQMRDSHIESLTESIYHSIDETSNQTGVSKIELKEWLTQYAHHHETHQLNLDDDLHIDGDIGLKVHEIFLHHSFSEKSSTNMGHNIGVRNSLRCDFGGEFNSKISINDDGKFGKYRYSKAISLIRQKSDSSDAVKHSINLEHELPSIGNISSASKVEVRHCLIENK